MPILRSPLRSPIRSSVYNTLVGAWALIPSLVFPSNVAAIDMDFVNSQFFGGTLPDASNNDDGRLLRQQIIGTQPNFLEQSDGSLKTYSVTSAVRRSNLFGIYCGIDFTNQDLQSRSFNNASWTAVGCTVAKNATGRTGAASSCCTITLTATTATLTLPVSGDATTQLRIAQLEAKQTVGSGGTIALSIDSAATFPTLTVKALNGAGALGFSKYRFAAGQLIASPQKQIKITGAINDVWVFDFSETLDSGTTNPNDIVSFEQPPIATTTAAVKVWRDRPTSGMAGYIGTTISSPAAVFMQGAVQAHYFEFWYRRAASSIIASAAGVQVSIDAVNGCTGFGLQTGSSNVPVITTDLRSPIKNKLMIGQSAGESFIALNGTIVTGAGGSQANSSDHDDWDTNGAADLRNCGGMFRHVLSTNYSAMKALAIAGATV